MRYSLLNYLCCHVCGGELTCLTHREAPCQMPEMILAPADRVSPAGAQVGPVPSWRRRTATTELLARHGAAPAPRERNYAVVVEEGLLACGECGRWYPISKAVPELLPDRLRQWSRDLDVFDRMAPSLPPDLAAHLRRQAEAVDPEAVAGGDVHKAAEIALPQKIEDPASFFGPGYVAPFNPWNPDHDWHLVECFAAVRPLLELKARDVVLDMGSGYSWTTEWLLKSGYEAIGVDICREYLEIALQRIGVLRPHLLVADVENLPFRDRIANAVLAFEAFHHIPDRPRALAAFSRVLKDGCPIALVEPGSAHEHSQGSIDAMEKYGTLEKGMDLADVEGYVAGLPVEAVDQQWYLRVTERELAALGPSAGRWRARSATANNLYVVRKRGGIVAQSRAARPAQSSQRGDAPRSRPPGVVKRVLWPRFKRRAKAVAVRLGLE